MREMRNQELTRCAYNLFRLSLTRAGVSYPLELSQHAGNSASPQRLYGLFLGVAADFGDVNFAFEYEMHCTDSTNTDAGSGTSVDRETSHVPDRPVIGQ